MITGVVKFFYPERRWGMIEQNEKGRPDIFCHREVLDGVASLKTGEWVTVEVVRGFIHPKYGTLKALRVALCKKRGEHERSSERERERSKVIPFGTD